MRVIRALNIDIKSLTAREELFMIPYSAIADWYVVGVVVVYIVGTDKCIHPCFSDCDIWQG